MEQLVPLPPIAKLSPLVTRILAQNPGKFTLQGTNTYLLGSSPPFILFDTGEGKPEYIPLLQEALAPHTHLLMQEAGGQLLSDIVLSHRHRDHHAGLPSVLALLCSLSPGSPPPRIWKHPLPPGVTDPTVQATLSALPPSAREWLPLEDGQLLHGSGISLQVLHTPGHTSDSVTLHVEEEGALLTADTVLGQGTTVFEDLAAYLASLERILERFPAAERVYPGHGPVVEQGRAHIQQYITHRLDRENQILGVLRSKQKEGDGGGGTTAGDVVRVLYRSYPESLWGAAERGVGLHLSKLEGEGRVRRRGGAEGREGAAGAEGAGESAPKVVDGEGEGEVLLGVADREAVWEVVEADD